jgi:hypothetical protein
LKQVHSLISLSNIIVWQVTAQKFGGVQLSCFGGWGAWSRQPVLPSEQAISGKFQWWRGCMAGNVGTVDSIVLLPGSCVYFGGKALQHGMSCDEFTRHRGWF